MKFLLSSKEEFYACKEFSWLLRCVTGGLCSLSPYFSPRYVSGGSGGLSAHHLPSDASRILWDPELPPRAGELALRGAGQTDRAALGPRWRGEASQQGTAAQSYPWGDAGWTKCLVALLSAGLCGSLEAHVDGAAQKEQAFAIL